MFPSGVGDYSKVQTVCLFHLFVLGHETSITAWLTCYRWRIRQLSVFYARNPPWLLQRVLPADNTKCQTKLKINNDAGEGITNFELFCYIINKQNQEKIHREIQKYKTPKEGWLKSKCKGIEENREDPIFNTHIYRNLQAIESI